MSYEHYNKNGARFISDTIKVDMTAQYKKFTSYLHKGASILDAGCGSGRDSLNFKNMGYRVQAFDASSVMVKAARLLANIEVSEMTFQSAMFDISFDGIWACASLLHVPRTELVTVIENLVSYLNFNGILYASFKYGKKERQKGDRYFNDLTEADLVELIGEVSNLRVAEHWINGDPRTGRSDEKWLNCILRKLPSLPTK